MPIPLFLRSLLIDFRVPLPQYFARASRFIEWDSDRELDIWDYSKVTQSSEFDRHEMYKNVAPHINNLYYVDGVRIRDLSFNDEDMLNLCKIEKKYYVISIETDGEVTDASIDYIYDNNPSIISLHLRGIQIGESGLEKIALMTSLKSITIIPVQNSPIPDNRLVEKIILLPKIRDIVLPNDWLENDSVKQCIKERKDVTIRSFSL